jgi:hypothetical protein
MVPSESAPQELSKDAIFLYLECCTSIFTCNSLRTDFFVKNSENALYSPKNHWIEKLLVPSESAPQELSNEWSFRQYYILGQFLCPALVTEVAIIWKWAFAKHLLNYWNDRIEISHSLAEKNRFKKKNHFFCNRPSSFCSRYLNMCDRTKRIWYRAITDHPYWLLSLWDLALMVKTFFCHPQMAGLSYIKVKRWYKSFRIPLLWRTPRPSVP